VLTGCAWGRVVFCGVFGENCISFLEGGEVLLGLNLFCILILLALCVFLRKKLTLNLALNKIIIQ